MNKMLLILAVVITSGCTSAGHFNSMKMSKYDSNTNYGTISTSDGFGVQIDYSRYQFMPESDALATVCKSQLTSIAYEHAKEAGREIEPINEQVIRISMGRNDFAGLTSCNAYVEALWKSKSPPE